MSEKTPRPKSFWKHRPTGVEAAVIFALISIVAAIVGALLFISQMTGHRPIERPQVVLPADVLLSA
jgi:hypothetical protein